MISYNLETLRMFMNHAIENKEYFTIEVRIAGKEMDHPEYITNHWDNLQDKLAYYLMAYEDIENQGICLKSNTRIRITKFYIGGPKLYDVV